MKAGRPALTLIHVLWFTTAAGIVWLIYGNVSEQPLSVRALVTLIALFLAVAVTHVLTFWIVATVVIPRLRPGSYWSKEVDSYLATVLR